MPALQQGKPQGFDGACRLLCSADFNRVFRHRQQRVLRTPGFTIRSCPHDVCPSGVAAGGARLGVTISRKTASRAVDRNRIKRLIRESFRLCRAQLPCADFLVVAHGPIANWSRSHLNQSLQESWCAIIQKTISNPSTPYRFKSHG